MIGIAAAEKVINDGSTTLAVYTNGIFDIKDSGSGCTVGTAVAVMGANLIGTAIAADLLNGSIVGKALETASASEVISTLVGFR